MGDEAECGGADIDELGFRWVLREPSEAEKAQHGIDGAHAKELVCEVQWTVLEGESLEEKVVHQHLLEGDFPVGQKPLEACLCLRIVCKGLFACAKPMQGRLSVIVDTATPLVNLLQHLLGYCQTIVKVSRVGHSFRTCESRSVLTAHFFRTR